MSSLNEIGNLFSFGSPQERMSGRLGMDCTADVIINYAGVSSGDGFVLSEAIV